MRRPRRIPTPSLILTLVGINLSNSDAVAFLTCREFCCTSLNATQSTGVAAAVSYLRVEAAAEVSYLPGVAAAEMS